MNSVNSSPHLSVTTLKVNALNYPEKKKKKKRNG